MARDDPDFLEFFAGEFWPLRRVGFLRTGDMVWTGEHGTAGQRFFLSGGVRYLGGPPCHLRAKLSLRAERDGRLLPVAGNPATRNLEGDLPGDGIGEEGGSLAMRGGPLFWSFYWDQWCNEALEGPARLILTSPATGQRQPIAGPGSGPSSDAAARTGAARHGWPPGSSPRGYRLRAPRWWRPGRGRTA